MYVTLEFVHTGESTPWETLQVCKTLNLLVNFSINTTYEQLFLLNYRPLSYSFGKSGRDGKK